uniref:RIKEN cDNA 1700003H04 gene n=1 Tax=Mus musculus TaxID=10090 RepID=J3QNU0_MOUSE
METLGEKETLLDDKPRNMLFQGSVALRRGWRRKKYHFSLFTDVLVVSKNVPPRGRQQNGLQIHHSFLAHGKIGGHILYQGREKMVVFFPPKIHY